MRKTSFNKGWMFTNVLRKTAPVPVTLPHDAMQTEPRIPGITNGSASAWFPGGKYVYTKTFEADKSWEGQSVILEFGGVYMDSKVYLNDSLLGGWLYGYTGFTVDLTNALRFDGPNELRVEVDNSHTPNSRWYTGSGIYRNVTLHVGPPVHIPVDGIQVETKSINPVEIEVRTELSVSSGAQVKVEVLDGERVLAEGSGSPCRLTVSDADLWCEENPKLYDVRVTVCDESGNLLDEDVCRTGFRKLTWNAAQGLMVNGKSVKLRGGCIHHDNGILGAAAPTNAEYRKAASMKKIGYNAIRSAHNPISKELLNACDELGMYIMDETFDIWKLSKSSYDYSISFESKWREDCGAMIHKDFSHPSVILYSVGNEIGELSTPEGAQINADLVDFYHAHDGSRPVTNAINPLVCTVSSMSGSMREAPKSYSDIVDPYQKTEEEAASGSRLVNIMISKLPLLTKLFVKLKSVEKKIAPVMDKLDIVGFNYAEHLYEPLHSKNPNRILVSSETFTDNMAKRWKQVEALPYLIGDFCWTAVDYLGETGVGVPTYGSDVSDFNKPFPHICGGCGTLDLLCEPDPGAYHAAVAWKKYDKPYIAVRPVQHSGEKYALGQWRGTDAIASWSFDGQEGKKATIEVYSPGAAVELYQDGVSLGKKTLDSCKAVFETPYRKGTLKAVAYDARGSRLGEAELSSAAEETKLWVVPECRRLKADGEDMTFVHIFFADNAGIVKTLCNPKVKVSVEGAAELVALGSAQPKQTESYQGDNMAAYNGKLGCWVRSKEAGGKAVISVRAEGGLEAAAEITVG